MTMKKLLLTLSIILSCGLIVGSLAYAQEAPKAKAEAKAAAKSDFDFNFDNDFNFDFDMQEPTTLAADGNFTFFVQGTFLGVHVEDISKDNMSSYGMHEVRGVGITEVVKDSPAEKAGLRKGDVILRFDGESVTSVRKLNRLVGEASADQSVKLTISRNGSEQEIGATLSKRKPENVFGEGFPSTIFRGTPRAR